MMFDWAPLEKLTASASTAAERNHDICATFSAHHVGGVLAATAPRLAELRVVGLIRADDLEAFLDLLRKNLAVNSERRGDEIVLSSTATL